MTHVSSGSRRLLLGGLLVAFSAGGCGQGKTPDAETTPLSPVKVASAVEISLGEWTEILGATQPLPDHVARISAAVEGHVHSVLHDGSGKPVAEGQQVARGQLVVELDDRSAKANRDKVQAQLDELEELKHQAEIAQKSARLDVERLEKLQPGDAARETLPLVSRIELEKVRLALQDAASRQRALTARERALRSDLKSLDVHLDYHKLRAPIAGRLTALQVVPGQTLAVGTIVAEVIDLESVDVVCPVPRHAAGHLAVGQLARLVPAGHDDHAPVPKGKVVYVAVQAQPETGSFVVKVRFPNKDLRIRANTLVRVEVQTAPPAKRWVIPETAVLEDQEPPAVFVVVEEEAEKPNAKGEKEKVKKAHKLQVEIGIRDRRFDGPSFAELLEHHDKDKNGTIEKNELPPGPVLERFDMIDENKDGHLTSEEYEHAQASLRLVQIERLEDPETKKEVPIKDATFIVEGAQGLRNDDVVKIEEKEEEKKDDAKGKP